MSEKCGIRLINCFFCRESTGIAIPKNLSMNDNGYCSPITVDYEPCKKCMEKFKKGVLIIEVRDTLYVKNQPEIVPGSYPSGRYWVVKSEIINKVKDGDVRFITEEIAKEIGLYDMKGE